MREKSKKFKQFHEDATDRGWNMESESAEPLDTYIFWTSIYANGERRLTVVHNPDGIATISENGNSIPQHDHNASPTNEDWLDALITD